MIEQVKVFRVTCDENASEDCMRTIMRQAVSKKQVIEQLESEGWQRGSGYHPRWDTPIKTIECPNCLKHEG